jgi:hypothetical protein
MRAWEADKSWSDRFIPQLKRILADILIGPAPEEEDQKRNTDLIVLGMQNLRIACRVRRPRYFKDYFREFTIRLDRPTGAKTELDKILDGFGDYFLYAFADAAEKRIQTWTLGRLPVFRTHYQSGRAPGRVKCNPDGTRFRYWSWAEFPSEFIADRNWSGPCMTGTPMFNPPDLDGFLGWENATQGDLNV